MKKISVLVLSALLLFCFTACNNNSEPLTLTDATTVNAALNEFMTAFVMTHNDYTNNNDGSADYVGSTEVLAAIKANDADTTVTDMYINMGAVGSQVQNIGLLGETYSSTDNIVPVSVGMNVFYRDPVYKIEGGNLLVNKAAFLFSLLIEEPLKINGAAYDDYSVPSFDTELTVTDVKFNNETIAEEDGAYTADFTKIASNPGHARLTYAYEGIPSDGTTDLVFVVTEGSDNSLQNSILTSSANVFSSYLIPYATESLDDLTNKTVTKTFKVLSSDGTAKGSFDLTVNVVVETETPDA